MVMRDPLTPEWREKIEKAASIGRRQVYAAKRHNTPRGDVRARVKDLERAWATGASGLAIALYLGVGVTNLHKHVRRLRAEGYDLPPRGRRHKPPPDWKARLDEIIAEAD